ncbi:hypothetical protein [Xanthomonas euvesicatoria]|uniref:hypothetical protein n=1 Tax=Xanthomonas euvesicatoria TaxID=456327 RepID=UPI0032B3E5A6
MEDRQKVVKNFCADSELAHFWLFFTRIPADPHLGHTADTNGSDERMRAEAWFDRVLWPDACDDEDAE